MKQYYFDKKKNESNLTDSEKRLMKKTLMDNNKSETPLMALLASVHCNDYYLKLLLSIEGMDMTIKDSNDQTALDIWNSKLLAKYKKKRKRKNVTYENWAKWIKDYGKVDGS